MKNTIRLVTYFIVFSAIVLPVFVFAQTTDMADGSRVSGSENTTRIRNWYRQSNESQQKISALGDVIELNVTMPVLFGVAIKDISPNYGVLRPSGRIHEGEDIMAVKGTPIVSPTPAVVIRTDYGAGEGNAVYTANPGGETYIYYHLDRWAEGLVAGQVLERGALIGYIGNTGSASTTAAHLHFEIRKDGVPTDPFVRLTVDFTPEEKMAYLTKILTQTTDPTALAQFLVSNFRSTFSVAVARGATIPPIIAGFLLSMPDNTLPIGSLPTGDLAFGSVGLNVTILQQFLIKRAIGPASARLASNGATNYFGLLTQAALVEYQIAVRISPANGYYGPSTQTLVKAEQGIVVPPLPPPPVPGTIVVLMRDLYLGMSGEDVRGLQKVLNRNGFTVAVTGLGSAGFETAYFGPATRAAVIKYQIARKIPATGNVGILTRASIATLSK